MKTPTSRGRPESIMQVARHDAFRPTETPRVCTTYNKLVVQDPIQKFNYRPAHKVLKNEIL